jgi:large subunit ribosomal protein L6
VTDSWLYELNVELIPWPAQNVHSSLSLLGNPCDLKMSFRSTLAPLRRGFHTSHASSSHIGSQPILLPPSVKLDLPIYSITPNLPMSTPIAQRIVTVTGPLGTQSILLFPPIILQPPTAESPHLLVTVHDANIKRQKAAWGLTRSLIHNAIVGVTEGFTTELRLVGVGYRATIEPIPQVFRDLQLAQPRKQRIRKPTSPPETAISYPVDRLNLKLGYSHPVLIDIPPEIKVTILAPTRIVITGTNKEKLGQFAATIRKWRKPEPYRGKVS